MMTHAPWVVALAVALVAGVTDWRSRRIPNWLTVSGFTLGMAANGWARGVPGLVASAEGGLLALGLLLPFVMMRGLGAGDWKLMGAVGACTGPSDLIDALLLTVLANLLLAAIMVVKRGRVRQTARNVVLLVGSLVRFRMPDREVSLDNPDSVKVPFGVAAAVAVTWLSLRHLLAR